MQGQEAQRSVREAGGVRGRGKEIGSDDRGGEEKERASGEGV